MVPGVSYSSALFMLSSTFRGGAAIETHPALRIAAALTELAQAI
jgi:hypothetical protein